MLAASKRPIFRYTTLDVKREKISIMKDVGFRVGKQYRLSIILRINAVYYKRRGLL